MNPRLDAPAVFLVGLAVRLVFIHLHPIIFGGDTVLRLANKDHVLLAYQLPVLQAAIWTVSRFTDELLAIRYLMALSGAAAGAGFYLLSRHFLDRRGALSATLLLATNPFLIQLSIVPYQEIPMLAALLFAAHFYLRARHAAAGVALGVACLTRYEAWIACPVMAVAWLRERGWSTRRIAQALVLFGWAPLAWMLVHGGFSAGGTFVIEWPASPERVVRWAYLGWIVVKNTPPPVLLLAALGTWCVWRDGLWRDRRLQALAGFLALLLISILFSAHGVSPDPERFVASREATLPIAAAVLLAGVAARLRFGVVLVVAGALWGLLDTQRFIVRDTSEPHVRLSYELARYLDGAVGAGQKVVVLARPAPPELVQSYLDKVRARGGDAGVEQARAHMASMDISPPDYQRTLIHSRLGRARLLPSPEAGADWIAAWSDYEPEQAGDAPVKVLKAGSLSVSLYRRR